VGGYATVDMQRQYSGLLQVRLKMTNYVLGSVLEPTDTGQEANASTQEVILS